MQPVVYVQGAGQATLSLRLQDSEGPCSFDACVVLCVLSVVFILISDSTVRQEEKRLERFSGHKAEDSTDWRTRQDTKIERI